MRVHAAELLMSEFVDGLFSGICVVLFAVGVYCIRPRKDEPMDDEIMQYFTYAHLRDDLKETSKRFADTALWIIETLPRNPERTVALRKLLEAKDAAVLAAVTADR
jgi:hypothetical protein